MGIRDYSPGQVCGLIRELHNKGTGGAWTRQSADLISDVAYLFKHRSQASGLVFLVKNSKGDTQRAKQRIYLVNPDCRVDSIAKHRHAPSCPFLILDDTYQTSICGQDMVTTGQLRRWLLGSPEISDIPTLVIGYRFTQEWRFLRGTNVMDLLLLLREYDQRGDRNIFTQPFLDAVPDLEVACSSGGCKPLKQPPCRPGRSNPHAPISIWPSYRTQTHGCFSRALGFLPNLIHGRG